MADLSLGVPAALPAVQVSLWLTWRARQSFSWGRAAAPVLRRVATLWV